ncbi:Uncharacterised protein [Vibrio cholerae]|nr:Uncharacterised protein [Vibrio cholerae]CSI65643.1 Uncharacterised protein [Vibrio cholerae]
MLQERGFGAVIHGLRFLLADFANTVNKRMVMRALITGDRVMQRDEFNAPRPLLLYLT